MVVFVECPQCGKSKIKTAIQSLPVVGDLYVQALGKCNTCGFFPAANFSIHRGLKKIRDGKENAGR
tara:strand:+ start:190 stop:387 length:198 start_codon:yes stop_codon:yes gene_type:complete